MQCTTYIHILLYLYIGIVQYTNKYKVLCVSECVRVWVFACARVFVCAYVDILNIDPVLPFTGQIPTFVILVYYFITIE